MQLQALNSKSFIAGALTMFIFSLGSLPVLLGITKLSDIFSKQHNKEFFYKVSGLVVITLALYEVFLLAKIVF
jgi:sulfite exporter TauE/SafE